MGFTAAAAGAAESGFMAAVGAAAKAEGFDGGRAATEGLGARLDGALESGRLSNGAGAAAAVGGG